jgi:Flp pilus assembly protein TadG
LLSGPIEGRIEFLKGEMGIYKKQKGQTLIETAIVLFLLLLILLGITEFARAWYTKNSLKNAARQGVRTAVVTQDITAFTDTACPDPCPGTKPTCTGACTDGNPVVRYAVCCDSPGVNEANTQARMDIYDPSGAVRSGYALKDDTVTITVTNQFSFIVGN